MAVASVLVGWVLQLGAGRRRRLLPMIIGAAVAVGTGVSLVVRQVAGMSVESAKIAVKLVVALLVLAAVILASAQRRAPSRPGSSRSETSLAAAGLLALVNVAVAVVWT